MIGAAYARAENTIGEFINFTRLPFLPTPMGKGVVSDSSPYCVAPARTAALQHADVIILLGARLNWILHFGRPPRFRADVQFIQVGRFYYPVSFFVLYCQVRGIY